MRDKIPFEYRVSLIYLVVGALWILFSDKLVLFLWADPYQQNVISIYKGWLYVLVTAVLLFIFIKKENDKRRKLYNKLLEANEKAKEADRLKSAFLSNLSHYIRTPMNSILGFIELLKMRNLDEEKRLWFLQIVDQRSNLLLQTINNIVEVSRLQEGLLEVNNYSFCLDELIRSVSLSFDYDAAKLEKSIHVFAVISPSDSECRVVADYDKIHNILTNLVRNAINFTEAGDVVLGCRVVENELEFYVRDTGKGIPKEKKERLFMSYLDGNTDRFDKSEGSGIGLYLSSRLAELLGGKLWLESTGESGSKFCLKVPFQKQMVV